MMRQTFLRVMLSLLLLVSQQMAAAHALTHIGNLLGHGTQAVQVDQDPTSASFAKDQSCNQCLAFAQLAGPLPATHPAFVVPAQQSMAIASAQALEAEARTRLAFRSRAPPQA